MLCIWQHLTFVKMQGANTHIRSYFVQSDVLPSHRGDPCRPTCLCYILYPLSAASFPGGKPEKCNTAISYSAVWTTIASFHATPMSHSSHKKQSSTLFRAVSFTLLFTHHHGADDTKCTAALRARRHWSETDRSQYTSLSQSNIIVTLNCGGFVVELLS